MQQIQIAQVEYFNISKEELKRPNLNTLFKNQGVYNGLLGVALLYGSFMSKNPKE